MCILVLRSGAKFPQLHLHSDATDTDARLLWIYSPRAGLYTLRHEGQPFDVNIAMTSRLQESRPRYIMSLTTILDCSYKSLEANYSPLRVARSTYLQSHSGAPQPSDEC